MRGKDRLWRGGVGGTRKGSGDVTLGVARAASLRMFQWTASREVRVTWASICRTNSPELFLQKQGDWNVQRPWGRNMPMWSVNIRKTSVVEGTGGARGREHKSSGGLRPQKCGFHFKWKILIKEELWSHLNGSLWLVCWWQVREGQGWKQEDQLGDHRWGDHGLDQGRERAGAKKCLGLGSVLKPPEFGDNVGYGVCRGKGGQMWFQRFQPQQLET